MHLLKVYANAAQRRPLNARKHFLWGLTLILVGSVFLLDRFGYLSLEHLLSPQVQWWHIWPAILVIAGLIESLSADRLVQVARGLFEVTLGAWLIACLEQWWGWTFSNSWPVLLIALGVHIVVSGARAQKEHSTTQDAP